MLVLYRVLVGAVLPLVKEVRRKVWPLVERIGKTSLESDYAQLKGGARSTTISLILLALMGRWFHLNLSTKSCTGTPVLCDVVQSESKESFCRKKTSVLYLKIPEGEEEGAKTVQWHAPTLKFPGT